MIPVELLVLIGSAAVLPYVAEAAWSRMAKNRRHTHGANAPD